MLEKARETFKLIGKAATWTLAGLAFIVAVPFVTAVATVGAALFGVALPLLVLGTLAVPPALAIALLIHLV